jgi:hypothetical protein
MKKSLVPFVLFFFTAAAAQAQTAPATCESLAKLQLLQAKILAAETVPADAFKSTVELPPWLPNPAAQYKGSGNPNDAANFSCAAGN